MALDTYDCPECKATLRSSPHLKPGDLVQCPRCRAQFPVPDAGTLPAPGPPGPAPERGDYSESPALPAGPKLSEAEDEFAETPRPPRRPAFPDDDYPRPRGRYPEEDDDDYPRPRGDYYGLEDLPTD
jgi:hypothetical protein